jgi:hydroxyquinol 1,2-dioxygenase
MTHSTHAHLADVLAAYGRPVNDRVGEIARAGIKHLFAFAQEVNLTREEWLAGIGFLTATGKTCSDQRQEFILLSDTLGLSMLIEMINQVGAVGTTEPTVFGPFHVPDAPLRRMGETIVIDDDPGEPLTFEGLVRDLDGVAIEAAELDVWQTASNGLYDVQDPEQTPMNLRGRFVTGSDGRYRFVSVRPVAYPIPDDGPVGDLLRASGRHNWRPAHTHVVVSAPGHKTIITHLFDRRSRYLDSDAVFGVREGLMVDMSGPVVSFDFVLERDH